MMPLLEKSFEIGCASKRAGQGEEVGGGANSMATSGLSCRNDFIGTRRTIYVLFCIIGVRNTLQGFHFQRSRPAFSYSRLAFLKRLN